MREAIHIILLILGVTMGLAILFWVLMWYS